MLASLEGMNSSFPRGAGVASDDATNGLQDGLIRVFLLEDNEGNTLVFEGFLEALCDAELVIAASLAELESFRDEIIAGAFDLVVFDIMLPDGESTEHLKEWSQKSPTPFWVYTARTSPADQEIFRNAGARHVMSKPLKFADFASCMEPVIEELSDA